MSTFNRWSPAVLVIIILVAMIYRYYNPLTP